MGAKKENQKVIDAQDAFALAHAMTQAGRLESLEHTHVVFMQSFTHSQMTQLMPAQIKAVEMADCHFRALMPCIVRGGLMPMTIHREAFVIRQFGDVLQTIRQRGGGDEGEVHVAGQITTAFVGQT